MVRKPDDANDDQIDSHDIAGVNSADGETTAEGRKPRSAFIASTIRPQPARGRTRRTRATSPSLVRSRLQAVLKSISYRTTQCELLRLRRRGASREPRAPSQSAHGVSPFRDVQLRDALPLRYGDKWLANYVLPPFCGARLPFWTCVCSLGRTEPPREKATTTNAAQSTRHVEPPQ
jgi:hypothetical protein